MLKDVTGLIKYLNIFEYLTTENFSHLRWVTSFQEIQANNILWFLHLFNLHIYLWLSVTEDLYFINYSIAALRVSQWQNKHCQEKRSPGSHMFCLYFYGGRTYHFCQRRKFWLESKIHSKVFKSPLTSYLKFSFVENLDNLESMRFKLISTFESGWVLFLFFFSCCKANWTFLK